MGYGKVGRQALADGVVGPFRLDKDGNLAVANYGGKYVDAVLAGRMFIAANQAAVALTAAFATTYTGLVLENPVGSGKNMILHEVTYASTVAVPTAAALGLMTGADAGDAASAITPRNRLKSGSAPASAAIVDNGCTLTGTPVLEQLFTTAWTEATTAGTLGQPNVVRLDGSLIITPGYFAAIYSSAANTAAFLFSFMWEEMNI
jgi:hypothetical protein